jgi:hypothetical protein
VHMNNFDDVAWTRLLDMQREMENRRLLSAGVPPRLPGWLNRLLVWIRVAASRLTSPLAGEVARRAGRGARSQGSDGPPNRNLRRHGEGG